MLSLEVLIPSKWEVVLRIKSSLLRLLVQVLSESLMLCLRKSMAGSEGRTVSEQHLPLGLPSLRHPDLQLP